MSFALKFEFEEVAAVYLCYCALLHEADATRFFRDHYYVRIGLLGYAHGSAVTHSVRGGKVQPVRYGEGAAGGYDAVVAYNHCTVVQGGILEEKVLYEALGDAGVHYVAGVDYALQVVPPADDDEGADLMVAHILHGGHKVGECLVLKVFRLVAPEEVAEDGVVAGGAAYVVEEAAYLRLENDDDGEGADVQYGAEHRGGHLHIEGHSQHPDHQDYYDGNEDVHGGRAADPSEDDKNDRRHQYDVDKIDKREM